jgi:hypothetical protein
MSTRLEQPENSLVIVTRNKPALHAYVKRLLASYRRIRVIVDRRRRERRRLIAPVEADRRQADRRSRRDVDDDLYFRGWTMIRRRSAHRGWPSEPEGSP